MIPLRSRPRLARVVLSVLTVVSLAAACATSDPRAPGKAAPPELASTGKLRVALNAGNPVLASRDPATGELRGVAIDLTRGLATQSRLTVEFIEYPTVPALLEALQREAWDMAFLAFDPNRQTLVDFTPPYMLVDSTVVVPPGSSIRSMADVDRPGVRVAVAQGSGSALGLQLQRTLKQARLVRADSEEAAFDLLKSGQADAYAQTRPLLLRVAERLPGARVLDDRLAVIRQAVALPRNRPTALLHVWGYLEDQKVSGGIQAAIRRAGLVGVQVAGPEPIR